MKLREYLTANHLSHAEFARRIVVTTEAARRYANGDRIPTPEIMGRIFRATAGAVDANDFNDLPHVCCKPLKGARVSA